MKAFIKKPDEACKAWRNEAGEPLPLELIQCVPAVIDGQPKLLVPCFGESGYLIASPGVWIVRKTDNDELVIWNDYAFNSRYMEQP